jgi:uncharacterized membrane protein
MRLAEWGDRVRHSLWFIPTLCTVAGAAGALGLIWISGETDADGSELPLLFSAGADGARAMLQAIAGSIITVAGVIFSVTVLALQLTSTQFSPRVLRNFLSDRSNQLVLGVFVGTFTYTILVLRSIKSDDGDTSAFVPAFAITGSLVLTLFSIGMLIYFIHHISVRIQVTSIVASIAADSLPVVRALAGWWEPEDDRPWHPAMTRTPVATPPSGAIPAHLVGGEQILVPAEESGYLQLVDMERITEVARAANGKCRLLIAPGAWVQAGAPIAAFASSADGDADIEALTHELCEGLSVAHERSLKQDVAFGVQQLVDVAVKALSPSMNDPTTANNCIDRLVEVLIEVGSHRDAPRSFADADDVVRLEIPFPTFDELVELAFDPIRHYGRETPAVVVHLARGLSILRSLPEDRHEALRRQARMLADGARSIQLEADRRRVLDAVTPLLD